MFFVGCGIKKPPKPPPYPHVQVKRLGDIVYVLTPDKDVVVEGFERKKGFWYKVSGEKFCFKVSHKRGRTALRCVEDAPEEKPDVEVRILKEKVFIKAKGFRRYRIYRAEEIPLPPHMLEFEGETYVRRDLREVKLAITGVVNGSETEPVFVRIPPVEPPSPEPPQDLSYTVRNGKIVLFWRGEEEIRYLVYRNNTLLTEKPIRTNLFIDNLPPPGTVYRVVAVNRFGVRSKPAEIVYRP